MNKSTLAVALTMALAAPAHADVAAPAQTAGQHSSSAASALAVPDLEGARDDAQRTIPVRRRGSLRVRIGGGDSAQTGAAAAAAATQVAPPARAQDTMVTPFTPPERPADKEEQYQRGIAALQETQYDTAWASLKPLADSGDVEAQYHIARMFENGWSRKAPSFPDAIPWYRKAAERHHAPSALRLAEIYRNGLGTPRSRREAYDWYLRAAQAGNAEAMRVVGQWNLEGISKKPNFLTAKLWLNRAARAGDGEAQTLIDDLASKNFPILEVPGTANPTEEAAQRVLSEVKNLLEPMLQASGGAMRMKLGQSPTITAEGDSGHLVTLPLAELTSGGETWRLGTVQMVFVPEGDNYAFEMVLPGQIRILGADGNERGVVHLGHRQITGTWSTSLHTLTDYYAEFADLRYVSREGSGGVTTLAGLTAERVYEPLADGRFAISEAVETTGLRSEEGTGAHKQVLRLAGLSASVRYDNVNPEALARLVEEFGIDWRTGAFVRTPARGEAPSALPALAGGMAMRLRVTDVAVEDAEGKVVGGLASGEFALDGSDLDKALSGLSVRYSHDGLTGEAGDTALPSQGKVVLAVRNLPAAELMATALGLVQRQVTSRLRPRRGGGANVLSAALPMPLLPQIEDVTDPLTSAGTELALEHFAFTGQGYSITASGSLKPAKTGVTGGLTIKVGGLDTLMGEQAEVVGEDLAMDPMAMLRKVKAEAKVEKDAAGVELRVFTIAFLPDGKITINGKDTETLFGEGQE